MSFLSCSLCSETLSPSLAEAHFRLELGYPSVRCQLCRLDFVSEEQAHRHFRPRHPGQPASLLRLPEVPARETRLAELLRLATGGSDAVQQRLCVCGHCRLLCREPEFRNPTPQAESGLTQLNAGELVGGDDNATKATGALLDGELSNGTIEPHAEQPNDLGLRSSLGPQIDGINQDQIRSTNPERELFERYWGEDGARTLQDKVEERLRQERSWPLEPAKMQELDGGTEQSFVTSTATISEEELIDEVESDAETKAAQGYSSLRAKPVRSPKTGSSTSTAGHSWSSWKLSLSGGERVLCRPCDKTFNRSVVLNHVAAKHLGKPLHACRLCPYTTLRYQLDRIRDHVKVAHNRTPGEDSVDSSAQGHYAPVIKAMIPKLFADQ